MMPIETAFGFIGALLFIGMIYYTRKSLKHFKEHKDVSLVKFFIDERGERAFEVLAGISLVYAISMVVTGMEFLYGSKPLLYASRGLILGVAAMMVYFTHEVYEVTKKNPEED
ncbi:MAG: hypothetical protein ABEK04_03810 [Candidatus Nanohalobium sp.]